MHVVPLVGTWIETCIRKHSVRSASVVPLVGTWIETQRDSQGKFRKRVVPLVGTWIETHIFRLFFSFRFVVPLVGTWIETELNVRAWAGTEKSFPSWERGLKPEISERPKSLFLVVPLVGTWIETPSAPKVQALLPGRSPRGNVD